MSKHTPGPWVARCRHVNYVEGQEWPEDEFLQWEVEGPRVPNGRGEFFQADARLIAAAPELLEACVELLAAERFSVRPPETVMQAEAKLGRIRKAVAQAEAAIAKATGEAA